MVRLITLVGALALIAACEAKIGKDEDGGNASAAVTAEGKAEEGTVSIKAPGVDIKVDIPESVRDDMDSDGDILYPGSQMGGIHIEAGGSGEHGGAVEIRFSNSEAPDKIAAWYRDTAHKEFKIDSETRVGDAFVFNGHERDDNSPFKVRLTPRDGGGTDGILSVRDRS